MLHSVLMNMLLVCTRRVGRLGSWLTLRVARLLWPPAWTQNDLEACCSLIGIGVFFFIAGVFYTYESPPSRDPSEIDFSEQHREKLIQELVKERGWKLVKEEANIYDDANLVQPGDYPEEIEAIAENVETRKPYYRIIDKRKEQENAEAAKKKEKEKNKSKKIDHEVRDLRRLYKKKPINNEIKPPLRSDGKVYKNLKENLNQKVNDNVQGVQFPDYGKGKIAAPENAHINVSPTIRNFNGIKRPVNNQSKENIKLPPKLGDVLLQTPKQGNLAPMKGQELLDKHIEKLANIFKAKKYEKMENITPPAANKKLLKVYDIKSFIKEDYECMSLNIKPLTYVCLYPTYKDVHVSYHIRQEGIWEPHIVKEMQNVLYSSPDIGLIDIGANIGIYSLIAASMGHQVIALEPFIDNIKHLQKAAQLTKVTDKITVLQNAVSDFRGKMILELPTDNQGGVALGKNTSCTPGTACHGVQTILMDDLVSLVPFQKAVIKIDIEGHEHRAFKACSQLLDKIYVPYIFMEWLKLKHYFGSEMTDTEDKSLTFDLVSLLISRDYAAYAIVTGARLKPGLWYAWPDDIIWKHSLNDVL